MCGSSGERLDGAGHLALQATPSAGRALMTKGLFAQRYGTFSAWLKVPAQAGYWPGWWLLNGTQLTSAPTGEVDVSEVYTTWPGTTNSRLHVWDGNGGSGELWESPNITCGGDLTGGFHKYSAVWTPSEVRFYLDGALCGTVAKAASPSPWAFDDDDPPAWLILDLAVGGAGQAAPSANATMLVDRVEVDTSTDAPGA